MGGFKQKAMTALLIVAASFALIPRTVLFQTTQLGSGDGKLVYLPFMEFVAAAYRNLSAPLWTPLLHNGFPLHASAFAAAFYPDAVGLMLFPPQVVWNLSSFCHFLAAGFGMYLFCRRVGCTWIAASISALVYLLGSDHSGWTYQGLLSLRVGAGLPFVLLSIEEYITRGDGRWLVGAAALLGVEGLAGHPQPFYLSALLSSSYLLFRLIGLGWPRMPVVAWLRDVAAFVAIAAGISAIQTIPTLELAGFSQRAGGMTFQAASAGSVIPLNLISLLMPHWVFNQAVPLYVGVFPLGLAMIAAWKCRNATVRFFIGAAAVSALISFGKYTPVYWVAWQTLPGIASFRDPSRFLLLTFFALSVLAGFGVDAIVAEVRAAREVTVRRVRRGLTVVAVLLATFVVAGNVVVLVARDRLLALGHEYTAKYVYGQPSHPYTREFYDAKLERLFNAFEGSISLLNIHTLLPPVLLLAGAYGLARYRRPSIQAGLPVLVLSGVLLDLLLFGAGSLDAAVPSQTTPTPTEAFLKIQKGEFRVYRLIGIDYRPDVRPDNDSYLDVPENYNMVAGISSVGLYSSLAMGRHVELLGPLRGGLNDGTGWIPTSEEALSSHLKILNLLNARYILASRYLADARLRLVQDGVTKIYENPGALPRAFLVSNCHVIPDPLALLDRMHRTDFNPDVLLLEAAPERSACATGGPSSRGEVAAVVNSPSEITFRVHAPDPAYLVLSDTYYPGWHVQVDGGESELLRADYTLRAVFVPGGTHLVRFYYDPLSFKVAALLSCTTLALVLGAVIIRPRRRS
jgi:hypothetical protein